MHNFAVPERPKFWKFSFRSFFFYFIDFWTNFFSFFFNYCPALSNFCSTKRSKNFSCVQIPSAFSFCSLLFAFASKTCKTCTKNFSKNVRRNASFSTRMGGWCRTVPWTAKTRTKRAFWPFLFFTHKKSTERGCDQCFKKFWCCLVVEEKNIFVACYWARSAWIIKRTARTI